MSSNALKRDAYGNIKALSMDGVLMFLCDDKKANWYLSRNLAKWVGENVIQFTFTTGGSGNANKLSGFLLETKENRCVVCGAEEDLTRHHVVPYCYRRWFPVKLKSKDCHDVLPLCIECHSKYEAVARCIKQELGIQYECPMNVHVPMKPEHRALTAARKAAATVLKYGHLIPQDRLNHLCGIIHDYLGKVPAHEELVALSKSDTSQFTIKNENTHGRRLVEKLDSLDDFVIMWRKHFLEEMQPKFLSPQWDINYRLEEYRNHKVLNES